MLNQENIILILTELDPYILISTGLLLILTALGFVFYLKRSTDPDFVKKALELKYKQKSLVGLVKLNLSRINTEINKLILDLEALDIYNTEHAKKLLEQVRYAEISGQFIYILDNTNLTRDIRGFLKESKETGIEIYKLEDDLYKRQFEYNTNIIKNNNILTNYENSYDPEEVADFRNIVNLKREELNSLINESQKKRKELSNTLKTLGKNCEHLQEKLTEYEKSKLDTKKFYFR
ncbi:hypothetical protein C4561_02785, partial [candidate division WWE3 bacterium]